MTTPPLPAGTLIDEALDIILREARTPLAWTDEPVDPEVVREIFETAKFGPTMMNSLPMRLTVVRSPEARTDLLSLMSPVNQDLVATAPIVAIVSADRDFPETFPITWPHSPGARDKFPDREQRGQLARMNATLQLAYLIISARAHGLDIVPMTGYSSTGIPARFLGDGDEDLIAVVALGHADGAATRPRDPRLPFERVVRFA
ncbi:MAG: malonic semialdehyde reductase [Actinomycetota bacterium]